MNKIYRLNLARVIDSSHNIHPCVKYIVAIFSLLLSLVDLMNAQVTDTILVEAGWNMISVPLKTQDSYYLTIFPGAISRPIAPFLGENPDDTLRIGKSYWIKFASAESYIISGEAIQSTIIDLVTGWNMIGSITEAIPLSRITSNPSGIIISDFFKYNTARGYDKSDTINPGSGYWIKVNQDGKMSLSSMGSPCPGMSTVDYEGRIYHTVQIGNQCWLKENLDIGIMINGTQVQSNNGVIEKYCYNNDPANCIIYGGLYHWLETMQYTRQEGAQGICPPGWHVPSYSEFALLSTTVSGNANALKEIGEGRGSGTGTNISGFSGLFNGYKPNTGDFDLLGSYGYFWCSREYDGTDAYRIRLNPDNNIISFDARYKTIGYGVRCIKN